MKPTSLFLVVLSTLILSGCRKDFDTLASWKESYAVYSILNLKDSAQYVRINRIFQSEKDPLVIAQVTDSVHIDPEDFRVYLEMPDNNKQSKLTIELHPSFDFQKEQGSFATDKYCLFKTTWLPAPEATYRLTIENIVTGFRMSAESSTLGKRNLNYSFKENRYYNIGQYSPELPDFHASINPSDFTKRIKRFLYYEMTSSDTVMRYVDWRPWLAYGETKATNDDTLQQIPDDHLKYLAANIAPDTNVIRVAVGIDNLLIINDLLLTSIIHSTSTDLSFHNSAPEITNFDAGAGFFAFRYYYTFFALRLRPYTIDSLAHGRFTGHLRFLDSNGNLP